MKRSILLSKRVTSSQITYLPYDLSHMERSRLDIIMIHEYIKSVSSMYNTSRVYQVCSKNSKNVKKYNKSVKDTLKHLYC